MSAPEQPAPTREQFVKTFRLARDHAPDHEILLDAVRTVFGQDLLPTVWVMEWWNHRDHYREVHLDRDQAQASLAEFVRGEWETVPDVLAGTPTPADDFEAIKRYYEARRPLGEDYEITEEPVVRTGGAAQQDKHQARVRRATLRVLERSPGDDDGTEVYVLDAFNSSTAVKDSLTGELHITIDAQEHRDGPVHVSVLRGYPEEHHVFYRHERAAGTEARNESGEETAPDAGSTR